VAYHRQKPQGFQRDKQAIEQSPFYPYLRNYLEARAINNYSTETSCRHDSCIRRFIAWCDERGLEDPRNITACMHLHFIAKNTERMGDHVTSIAEQVIFLVTGKRPEEGRIKADTTSTKIQEI